nr:breast cancer type 1 susceptibility protein homolog [Nomia melanderi]
MEQTLSTVEKLSEEIQNMQKCLQCPICLHTISDPARTRCGHRFCRDCIQTVLQSKNAACPLCNAVIHRRSICKDEHMEIYKDRLEKLIQAIQKDSGIDISLYVPRKRSTRESCSSENTDQPRSDSEDSKIQPSCSYAVPKPLKRRSAPQSSSKAQKPRRSRNGKVKKDNTACHSNITKYFSNCTLSGFAPLPTNEQDYSDDNSTEFKVQSWLETLSATKQFDVPNRIGSTACDLDDTLTYSVSQDGGNKVDTAVHEPNRPLTSRDDNCPRYVTPRRPSKDQKPGTASQKTIKPGNPPGSSETSNARSIDRQNQPQQANRRVSTSTNRSSSKEIPQEQAQNQEKTSDVHKTSPCDLLPSMKKNWTSVVQFGKEMRSKGGRRKKKSLNVSRENKNKKSADEASRQEATKKREQPKRRGRRSVEDTRVADNDWNEGLPAREVTGEQGPRDKKNGSMSESQPAKESSFIMLDKGEEVHIRNLNSHQMNDIIGVTAGSRAELEIENPPYNQVDEEEEFAKKLGLCRTPKRDQRSRSLIDATAVREAENLGSPMMENVSPSGTERIKANELCSTSNFQSSTPLPSRLSLKRQGVQSSDTQSADSRLMSVKRDLNREIIRSEEESTDKITRILTLGAKDNPEEGCKDNLDGPRSAAAPSTSKNKKQEDKRKGSHGGKVMFQKLGKVVKPRRKRIIFLYLGSTRGMFSKRQDYVKGLQSPCNTVELNEPQKAYPEKSFGNSTRITVNDMEEARVQENPAKDSDTNTKRASMPEEAPLNADQPEISVNKAPGVQRQTFDADKTTTSKATNKDNDAVSKNVVSTTAASQLCDSNDILFVSLYENEERDSVPLHRPVQPALKSDVKMLTPKKDTQLKPLSPKSPTASTGQATRLAQQGQDIGAKKSNLSDVKGVHSRALIRTSQRRSEGSEIAGSPCKKRKRSASRDNPGQMMKRTTKERDQTEKGSRDGSFKSSHRRNSVKDLAADSTDNVDKKYYILPPGQSTRYTDVVSVSSNSDTDAEHHLLQDQKRRVYKRIVPKAVSSDTDSSDVICLTEQNRNVTRINNEVGLSPTSKRKRPISPDSDSYNDLNTIVNDWSKDLMPTDRFNKKGKLEASSSVSSVSDKKTNVSVKTLTLSSSRIPTRCAGLQRRRLLQSDTESNSEKSNTTTKKGSLNKADFNDDSPDFGAIIDKIRGMQTASIASDEIPRQNDRQYLMQDNFDEVIANVDTESLADDFGAPVRSTYVIMENTRKEQHGGRLLSASEERLCNSSDKENRYKGSSKVYDTESDDDKTLTPEYIQAAGKSSRKEGDRSISGQRNDAAGESFAAQLVTLDSDKMAGGTVSGPPLKDSFDHDSLMNVTEHQLRIKQFEEDLFGKPVEVNVPTTKRIGEQLTPPSSRTVNRSSNMQNMDAEHSDEEDDIVENTPDVKTKNLQAINSTLQENPMTSPVSHINGDRAARTPPSVSGGSSTASSTLSKKNIRPIYQSTPRVCEPAKNDCAPVVGTSGKKPKPAGNVNMSLNRGTSTTARTNGASINQRGASRQKLRFICSGLQPAQIEQVKKFAILANADYQTQFDPSVTHVIVKEDKGNSASKTLKYLQGVAHGKWVVGYQWVIDSLKEARPINAENYEVVDCGTFEAGPRRSRLRQKGLFEGFVFLCIGPYSGVSVEQFQELLRATGGTVVDTVDATTTAKSRLKIIVIQADKYDYEIIGWHKTTRGVPVVHDWVVECISQYRLISFYPYLLELSRQDVLALGYPEYLVEEDPEDLESSSEDTM